MDEVRKLGARSWPGSPLARISSKRLSVGVGFSVAWKQSTGRKRVTWARVSVSYNRVGPPYPSIGPKVSIVADCHITA